MATALLIIASLSGCTPTCQDVCTKLVACDGLPTERMTEGECEEQCSLQQDRYNTWDDVAKREAFDDELTCLYESTCEQVAAGACYDEDVYSF